MATVSSLTTILGIARCTICDRVNVGLGLFGIAISSRPRLGLKRAKAVLAVDKENCINWTKLKNAAAR